MRVLRFVVLVVVIALTQARKPHYDLNDGPALFEKFIKDYDRHYKDDADRQVHYQAFLKTLEVINKSSLTYDVNNMADFTLEETKQYFGRMSTGSKPQMKPTALL